MKKYRTIQADPPRKYRNENTGGSMRSGSSAKYPVMTDREIIKLPIHKIAHKNSVLLLWATTPLLPETFDIMKAWGYRYKTAIYWRKIMSLGLGFWFRGQVELCLLGIKGKVKAFRCQRPNFIQCKVGRHSEKPDEFFELINPVVPRPRIELFARRKRKGWDVWGNEVKSDIEL